VATVRERRAGVFEIRVFTGRDAEGRPTQVSQTVRGTKRDAQRAAARLESSPRSTAGGRTVTDVLTVWRESMSSEDVRTVIEAARTLDPAAGLALRLAAVAGLRRSELAALHWTDFDIETGQLTVDSSITVVRGGEDGSMLIDSATKTADRRVLRLDAETMTQVAALRAERERVNSYLFSIIPGPPNPDRIG